MEGDGEKGGGGGERQTYRESEEKEEKEEEEEEETEREIYGWMDGLLYNQWIDHNNIGGERWWTWLSS